MTHIEQIWPRINPTTSIQHPATTYGQLPDRFTRYIILPDNYDELPDQVKVRVDSMRSPTIDDEDLYYVHTSDSDTELEEETDLLLH